MFFNENISKYEYMLLFSFLSCSQSIILYTLPWTLFFAFLTSEHKCLPYFLQLSVFHCMDVPSFIQLAHYCIVSRLLLLETMPQGTTWYIRPMYAGMPSGLPLLGQKINASCNFSSAWTTYWTGHVRPVGCLLWSSVSTKCEMLTSSGGCED